MDVIDCDLLKRSFISNKDIEYIKTCYRKYKEFCNKSDFIARGCFGYSNTFIYIKSLFELKNEDRYTFIDFLTHVIENSEDITCHKKVNITYFDKKYVGYIHCLNNHFWIDEDEYLLDIIKSNIHLSDSDLGKLVKETKNKPSKTYNNEFYEYLKKNGLDECKLIFKNWFKNCYIKLFDDQVNLQKI